VHLSPLALYYHDYPRFGIEKMAGRLPDFPGVQRRPQISPSPGMAKAGVTFPSFLFPWFPRYGIIIFNKTQVIAGSGRPRTENRLMVNNRNRQREN
jgi:hypothetical protein